MINTLNKNKNKNNSGICIFADTRAEWLAAMWGCFKSGITLATIYANLGDEGIVHGVTQTGVGAIITSQELLPKLFKLMEQVMNMLKAL